MLRRQHVLAKGLGAEPVQKSVANAKGLEMRDECRSAAAAAAAGPRRFLLRVTPSEHALIRLRLEINANI